MKSMLDLDEGLIARCREAAGAIADDVQSFATARTTASIERAVLRLMGVEGAQEDGTPLVNLVVSGAAERGLIGRGVAGPFALAVERVGGDATRAARELAQGKWELAAGNWDDAVGTAVELARAGCGRIAGSASRRSELVERLGIGSTPLLYVIVASGNIYEDVVQAKVAAGAGAQVIAVIRHTAQSLLDYVPEGAHTGGFGGTYASQDNFRIMREALDEVSEDLGRYVLLCNYASGLCMPEMAVLGGIERLDMMLNDALYGILFRDINMQRTLTDQAFSRLVSAAAGIVINTGEDNYLTTADPVEAAHTVLASQFINEALALRAGLKPRQIGLGHAMEMDPSMEDMFVLELAQARMVREIFPDCPIKYMPPTKHMTGDIFRGHVQDALFALASVMTDQGIHLLGMMTEAMHTPHVHDRFLALEAARLVMGAARHLSDEVAFRNDGRIKARVDQVLARATAMLETIRDRGLFEALGTGMFADVSRAIDGGRGLGGVFERAPGYFNPVETILREMVQG